MRNVGWQVGEHGGNRFKNGGIGLQGIDNDFPGFICKWKRYVITVGRVTRGRKDSAMCQLLGKIHSGGNKN